MVFLKSLTLNGFKAFAEKTTLSFDEGIAGLIGPNGCGKSNIIDAIRWVVGEQKSSELRSGKME
ncbi:MAG: AAA family ATPase, partial [Spirochaetia bacterium]|nr:AAA family ATPase [Spirochaetia bacterium]